MEETEKNPETVEQVKKTEQPNQSVWPGIVVGVVIIIVFSIWFVNDPSYEPLLGILTGITALISFIPKKNVWPNWLLVGGLVVVAMVGIYFIRKANDPEEIVIMGIFYDGVEEQEGDEYVLIRNEDSRAIQLEGWTLNDNQMNHVFTFPRYEMQPGEECRIYTDEDHPEWCGFNFRNGGSGVWNNNGDMATLRNADGFIIDSSIDLITEPSSQVEKPAPEEVIQATPTLTANYDDLECIPRDTPREVGLVVDVIDGRTVEVELADGSIVRVRYLGIATIVAGQPLFAKSVAINEELVLGKYVTLVEDREAGEAADVLLRYVFVDDTFVNHYLVQRGYALPDDSACSCEESFINMMIAANESDSGFTGFDERRDGNPFFDTPAPSIDNILISEVFYDGEKGEHEPDEYVEIRNGSREPIQLQGWTLRDESEHVFVFPNFTIAAGKSCRIYTNEDHPEWCGFNYESAQAIWGNRGDCATLRNPEDEVVGRFCY